MKTILCFVFLGILPSITFCQNIDVDKLTGAVKVNGKEVFFMIAKNKVMWEADYALESIERKQLAYFKLQKKIVYNRSLKSHDEVQYYTLSFEETGDHCDIKDYMDDTTTIVKALAKKIVMAGIIDGNGINEKRERKFILLNNGIVAKDSAVKLSQDQSAPQIIISIKGKDIYNNGQAIGFFKTIPIEGLYAIQVYNTSQNRVAEATHAAQDPNWTIVTPVDQQKTYLPYNKPTPLEDLLKYLVMKNYL